MKKGLSLMLILVLSVSCSSHKYVYRTNGYYSTLKLNVSNSKFVERSSLAISGRDKRFLRKDYVIVVDSNTVIAGCDTLHLYDDSLRNETFNTLYTRVKGFRRLSRFSVKKTPLFAD